MTCPAVFALCAFLLLSGATAFGDGVSYADSTDFTLDTTGVAPDIGGVAYADSANFTLDTTGTTPGVGGVAYADSANFTLDTTAPDMYQVNTLADSVAGSLRQIIAGATQNGVITFTPGLTGTITLTGGELEIGKSLTIIGPGATNLTINGNNTYDSVIYVSSGIVNLSGLTITGGTAENLGEGGGIYNEATVTVSNCIITGNGNASTPTGGGLGNEGNMILIGCTVCSNTASSAGAGIYNHGHLSLTNCTICNNKSTYFGGGIFNGATVAAMTSCTVASNSAGSAAGGIYDYESSQTVGNSIVAGNTAPSAPDIFGTITSQGFNLVGMTNGASGVTWLAGDQIGRIGAPLNPMLGPPQLNGGPTPTMALLAGSPAIDAGISFGVTTDQRGQFRPSDSLTIPNATGGDGSDIGAFEVAQTIIVPTLSVIFAVPNSVIVSWPSSSTGFTLQTNGNLATGNWVNYAGIVGDNGTIKTVTNSPRTGTLFFRLKK